MRYLKLTSDHKNEELTTIAPQKPFEILTTTPDIILCIAEFLLSSEKWFGYRLVNHRTREIFQDIFENHVRHCILNQCETALLQCQGTLIEKLKNYPVIDKPFITDFYRINFIVHDDHQHIISKNTVQEMQENIPFGASHQAVNKELLQTMFHQISSHSLSSNSDRKIPLICMQLLARKYHILGMIAMITACVGITLTIITAESQSKTSTAVVAMAGIMLSVILVSYILLRLEARIDNSFRNQKNSQNALAANVIKTGRIAVGQSDDSNLRHISFDLYIPQNTLTFFHQPNNGGALAITSDTRVVEIPETPEREPGANGSAVEANMKLAHCYFTSN